MVGVAVIEPGSIWYGPKNHSRWMVFAADTTDLYDLWCMNPGTSQHQPGRTVGDVPEDHIRRWLTPALPAEGGEAGEII